MEVLPPSNTLDGSVFFSASVEVFALISSLLSGPSDTLISTNLLAYCDDITLWFAELGVYFVVLAITPL